MQEETWLTPAGHVCVITIEGPPRASADEARQAARDAAAAALEGGGARKRPRVEAAEGAVALLAAYARSKNRAHSFALTNGPPPFVATATVGDARHAGGPRSSKALARSAAADAFFEALLAVEPESADAWVARWRAECSGRLEDSFARSGLDARAAAWPADPGERFSKMRKRLISERAAAEAEGRAVADVGLTAAECRFVLARREWRGINVFKAPPCEPGDAFRRHFLDTRRGETTETRPVQL